VSDRALRIALALLCLAGAGVSAFVLAARWRGTELLCSTGGCETVQSSPYAELAGVPVAAFGLAGYLLIAATAGADGPLARIAGASLALGAVLFSAYLLVIQVAVIGAVCDWCLANDAIASLVAVTALLRLRGALFTPASRVAPAPGMRQPGPLV
jgi:uncharacterized membrane protein